MLVQIITLKIMKYSRVLIHRKVIFLSLLTPPFLFVPGKAKNGKRVGELTNNAVEEINLIYTRIVCSVFSLLGFIYIYFLVKYLIDFAQFFQFMFCVSLVMYVYICACVLLIANSFLKSAE